jgi:hypothetical protein
MLIWYNFLVVISLEVNKLTKHLHVIEVFRLFVISLSNPEECGFVSISPGSVSQGSASLGLSLFTDWSGSPMEPTRMVCPAPPTECMIERLTLYMYSILFLHNIYNTVEYSFQVKLNLIESVSFGADT